MTLVLSILLTAFMLLSAGLTIYAYNLRAEVNDLLDANDILFGENERLLALVDDALEDRDAMADMCAHDMVGRIIGLRATMEDVPMTSKKVGNA